MRVVFTLLIVITATINVYSKGYHYAYTDNCSKAYSQYMALNPKRGDAFIKEEILADPYNLLATYIADYNDCLLLLFNGDERDYQQLRHHQNERLKLLERGDENSPWHRLCKAGIYIHWAFVHLRFNEQLRAGLNFRKAYIQLRDNKRLFPNFEYTNIFLGIEDATVGSIPDNYKWIATLFGMKGNVLRGIKSIEQFIVNHKKGDAFYEEAQVYYAYMNYYLLSDKKKAWSIVDSKDFDVTDNLLFCFVKVNIAMNFRKAETALTILEARQKDYEYPIFYYEHGYALLHKLDSNAIGQFSSFLKKYNGRIFVQDALQKMSYLYYLNGNMQKASYCRKQILSYNNPLTDSDKQALRFAERDDWPEKSLLRAQLLTDGGYYHEAYSILSQQTEDAYNKTANRLEFHFRHARVNDELGNKAIAIEHYNKAIRIGKDRQEQFAARSALQLGFLFENQGDIKNAVAMYELALSMKNHDFKSSIDQQAKAGINRLEQ